MKKLWKFLQSMTFGIIILALIALISAAGSLILQNQDAMYYVRTYPSWYKVILTLQLNDVYNSWYFNLLAVLLIFNLTFCSILRFRRVSKDAEMKAASLARADVLLEKDDIEKVKQTLSDIHCNVHEENDRIIYAKNRTGRYGTFITHLGILLTVIFFMIAMHAPTVQDLTCYPGNALTLDDGTQIKVDDFQIENEAGSLDYKSRLEIIVPDGRSSGVKEASVNHPVSLGEYKVYQQTYGTVGIITVRDEAGNKDRFIMDDQMFLTKDQKHGILFNALYPDIITDEDGQYSLITNVTGSYPNPVYTFNLVEPGEDGGTLQMTPMLAFPGDEIETGGLTFTFEKPMEYPGLRIKHSPAWVNVLLVLGFTVLIAGLAVTFLMEPVLVVVDDKGYKILGNKNEGIELMLENAIGKGKE
ncbi:MAG: cytochrome c biogenesis protein ResB [Bulleidia sp.]|nr:cytochrome c biogenesis protein ResB [Bulleidia sp.]